MGDENKIESLESEELTPAWVTTLAKTISDQMKEALQGIQTLSFPTASEIAQEIGKVLQPKGEGADLGGQETKPITETDIEAIVKRLLEANKQTTVIPPTLPEQKRSFLYRSKRPEKGVDPAK